MILAVLLFRFVVDACMSSLHILNASVLKDSTCLRRRNTYMRSPGVSATPRHTLMSGGRGAPQKVVVCASASASTDNKAGVRSVVVIGGGIHGCAATYYLSKKLSDLRRRNEKEDDGESQNPRFQVTLLEREDKIACSASGQAGGFLAADWGDAATDQLHKQSFELHAQLAKELDIKSYRTIPTLQVRGGKRNENGLGGDTPTWLDGEIASARLMDDPTRTAQVTPAEVTNKLAQAAENLGAVIKTGQRVVGVVMEDDCVTGVRVRENERGDETVVPCTDVLICMGVWSTLASQWFGLPADAWPITGIKSTHCLWKQREAVRNDPYALFCAEDGRFGTHLEVYPRSDGSLYICGIGGSDYVEGDRLKEGGDCERATMVAANPSRVEAGSSCLKSMTSEASDAPDEIGACMRPCAPDARPLMGPVPGIANAYINAAHNCWGITWGPIAGKVMSELILDGKASLDLSAFRADRYTTKVSRRGRKQQTSDVGEQW